MTPIEVAAKLRAFNEWRRSDYEPSEQPAPPDPREIGEALDAAVEMIERAESDLSTAEQDSRQKQARIERLERALRLIADTDPVDAALDPQRAVRVARDALEESK